MSEAPEFIPGRKLPTLGVATRAESPWERFGLPTATGLGIALVVMLVT